MNAAVILALCMVAVASSLPGRYDEYRNDGYRNDGYRNDGYRNDRYRNLRYRTGGFHNRGYGEYNLQQGYVSNNGYPKLVANYPGVYYGVFNYLNSCPYDGLYLATRRSFIQCTNGIAYHTFCAPGTQNAESYDMYSYVTFCGVNLVDNQLVTHE